MLETPAAGSRVTALDALALAQQKWLAGERLDIGRLADELGVGRATVFRWVGSKEQLYGEVISAAFAQTLAWARRQARAELDGRAVRVREDRAVLTARAPRAGSTGTGARFLTEVTRNLLTALLASRPLRRFIAHDAELAMRIVMSPSSPVEHRVIGAVRALIEEQVAAGHLEPALDTGSLAYVIVRIAESFLYRDVISGDEPDVETATKAIGLLFTARPEKPRKPRR